ncbi:MAG: hypothetical protein ACTTK5_03670 [Candidatus Fimenecus sp.]
MKFKGVLAIAMASAMLLSSVQALALDKGAVPGSSIVRGAGENREKATHIKYVKLKFTDPSPAEPHVRQAADDYAEIIEKEGKRYLRFYWFSKLETERGYDSGTMVLQYSDEYIDEENKDKRTTISDDQKFIADEGKFDGPYVFTYADIPIDGKSKLFLYGTFKVLNMPDAPRYEHSTKMEWEDTDKTVDKKLGALEVLNVKQGTPRLKGENEPESQFDFTDKDGTVYSPLKSKDRKKFLLINHNWKGEIEINVKRYSFLFNDLRHIKYTLDGSEPTFDSPSAKVQNLNSDSFLPNKFYRMSFMQEELLKELPREGGNLTLKIKGFNADGTQSTETKTLVLPFQEETVDETEFATVEEGKLKAQVDTASNFALDKKTSLKIQKLADPAMTENIGKMISDDGATNPRMFKLSVVDENGELAELMYHDSWNEAAKPVARLAVKPQDKSLKAGNLAIYEYVSGRLRQISSEKDWSKSKFALANISQAEGYYVIAEKPAKKQYEASKAKLIAKMEEAKPFSAGSSDEALELKNIIERAQLSLDGETAAPYPRPAKAENMITWANEIEDLITIIKNKNENTVNFDLEKAKEMVKIAENDVLKKICTVESLEKIAKRAASLADEIQHPNTKSLIAKTELLEDAINKMEFKFPSRQALISFMKAKEDSTSMANAVIKSNATIVEADDASYLLIDLQPMHYGKKRGHMLTLSVFEGEIDNSKIFETFSLGKTVDRSFSFKKSLFNTKVMVKLGKDVKDIYNMRVDSDAMNGANPQARLRIIKSDMLVSSLSVKVNGTGGKAFVDKTLVKIGEKAVVTLSADKGYVVDKVLVNGKATAVSDSKLSLDIIENTEVVVSFKKKPVNKPTVKKISMYRLYNPNSGEHFYTKDTAEKNHLVSLGWKYEGIGWTAPSYSNTPVYRLYNPNAGEHHYTLDKKEKNNLVKVGWRYEGIGWYSDDAKGVPLYRQYNPNAFACNHNYTKSKVENDRLVSLGWKYEGIGWYGVK